MSELVLLNRQRVRRVNTSLLRKIVRALINELVGAGDFNLCIHIVAAPEMGRINQQFLRHEGSTDVITFDHSKITTQKSKFKTELHGEIFICLDDAITHARQFRTTWQSEVARYTIHGILHLLGYDDKRPAARAKMKHEENRLLRRLSKKFILSRLAQPARRS